MTEVLDFALEVSDFDLQSRCHVRFRTNTLGDRYKSLYPTQLEVK